MSSNATRMIPSADNRPAESTVPLSEQLRLAEAYAQRADKAIPRAKTPEARTAGIKRATESWDTVTALKTAIGQQEHQEIVKAVQAAKPVAPKPIEVTLATATVTVRFVAYPDTVTIITTKDGAGLPTRLTTTKEHARAEYARLLKVGYWKW